MTLSNEFVDVGASNVVDETSAKRAGANALVATAAARGEKAYVSNDGGGSGRRSRGV